MFILRIFSEGILSPRATVERLFLVRISGAQSNLECLVKQSQDVRFEVKSNKSQYLKHIEYQGGFMKFT